MPFMRTLFAIAGLVGSALFAPQTPNQDLRRHFEGIQGTFVLLDGQTGEFIRHNAARADERFAPCSTFKIPNTAILLETGVAPDAEFVIPYDPNLNERISDWARDHSLRSAYKSSVMWYYRALAQRAGLPAITRLVRQFGYGNAETTAGVGARPFWVDGTLKVSANEQVAFLRRLYEGRLGVAERTTKLTKEIMIAERTPRWTLSAKTGSCQPIGSDVSIWYVGYVEKASGVWYFALQMGDTNYDRLFSQRLTKARDILADLGVLH